MPVDPLLPEPHDPNDARHRRWSIETVAAFADLIHARERHDFDRGMLATKTLRRLGVRVTLPREPMGVSDDR